ncbi:DUF6932 family protein [Mycolicibacterium celeriflavum]|uniref:Uncharacterized protein n=1 Tax=Mycolicibacterium celeriflavum TaxID=1249101 RepID=A0A1X0BKQ0_MYCCF|nr:hypothetical protein [Mycolicibacterium celeriflavum]MCV7236545.1 hypothetical protein [Mycolicibacterium celeriflavum]ORA43044.1 hypothetical protein BST21_22465 [Mycolicibacterium celeriflavum]BBY41813.1 hypothetical protein MCEL_01080 [Mycolicibacterium celeriflavum]
MIPKLTDDGDLPRGRFCASVEDIEKRFVADSAYEESTTREQIWSDFIDLVELIRRLRVRVPAAFVGGSFVTDKTDPSDVDAALFIDMSRITRPDTFSEVEKIVANPKVDLGLKVDAFLIQWHPDGTQVGREPNYIGQRGTWDDFWQRKVAKADRNPPQRSHAMPVRGYLEVVLDGYR